MLRCWCVPPFILATCDVSGKMALTCWDQVEELELSKARATELLKSHDGNALEAIRAYVTPAF
jgi:hypothetical protein